MNFEENLLNKNNHFIEKVNTFSDENLQQEITIEEKEYTSMSYNYHIPEYNRGNKNIIKEITKKEEGLSNEITIPETKFENDEPNQIFNLMSQDLFILINFLKDFFNTIYNVDISPFDYYGSFGTNIELIQFFLKLKIYQIFCFQYGNIAKILRVLKSKIRKEKKQVFIYFMTRTYEELYNRYISGDSFFPINKNKSININEFITLKDVIAKMKINQEDKNKNDIDSFIESSENMIYNISSEIKNYRKIRKYKITYLEEFEKSRKDFEEDIIYDNINSITMDLEEE